jgi:hypothetical protein
MNYAVRNPVRLSSQEVDFAREIAITATDVEGNTLTIIASRARWEEAFFAPVRPSQAEVARNMFVRGELEVEDFERVLEREL